MKLLVIDNYDSFTYNLVHIIRELGYQPEVWRNDQFKLEEVGEFDKILLSPGPGIPSEAGLMPQVIQKYAPSKDILGVCLGHQAIAEAFGAKIFNLDEVLHGIADTCLVEEKSDAVFEGLPQEFKVGRYHSWSVVPESCNAETGLQITARDRRGEVMALRHRELKVRGLQFHPESILTEHGKKLMQNWLEKK
ncbi:anthranilate synthase component II [Nafulsella turpanensis]|uniref:anthranilate synthase component II n=1 Tax=Nafulsella turpanensis TaxID=1265690 RepID=UPI00034D0BCA|nr:aminodeoxychorismate/anthranilate synthase component II [Nafulsella turpanensis]